MTGIFLFFVVVFQPSLLQTFYPTPQASDHHQPNIKYNKLIIADPTKHQISVPTRYQISDPTKHLIPKPFFFGGQMYIPTNIRYQEITIADPTKHQISDPTIYQISDHLTSVRAALPHLGLVFVLPASLHQAATDLTK